MPAALAIELSIRFGEDATNGTGIAGDVQIGVDVDSNVGGAGIVDSAITASTAALTCSTAGVSDISAASSRANSNNSSTRSLQSFERPSATRMAAG